MNPVPAMTVAESLRAIAARTGGECARHEAELIFQHVLGCSRSDLYLSGNRVLSDAEYNRIDSLARKRETGMPLPYALGTTFFHSVSIEVSPDVLIPRPDTEILVETACARVKRARAVFLDLCTGSGAVAAALLKQRPHWRCVAADISFPALRVAAVNIPKRRRLVCGDMLAAFRQRPVFNFIVCNPPYIPRGQLPFLETGVTAFEPHAALDGGIDGLDFYRLLAGRAAGYLPRGGMLLCEIGADQDVFVTRIFHDAGWENVETTKDLAGRPRVLSIERAS